MSTAADATTAATTTWTGEGLTQEDFMHKDECILVDEDDRIVGYCIQRWPPHGRMAPVLSLPPPAWHAPGFQCMDLNSSRLDR